MKKIFSAPAGVSNSGKVNCRIQNRNAHYIATYGDEMQINIYDRHGKLRANVPLIGNAVHMDWDKNGGCLAVINDKASSVTIWDASTMKISQFGTNFKENLSCLSWSKVDLKLAIGTVKGNLLIYDAMTSTKTPILGRHTRKLISVIWSPTSLLATSGEDKTLTINSMEGDLIRQVSTKEISSHLQFAHSNLSHYGKMEDNVLSCINGTRSLLIWKFHEESSLIELSFKPTYGDVVAYQWHTESVIIIGFSSGNFVLCSVDEQNMGQEISTIRDHKENLLTVALSHPINRFATASDKCVKIHDITNVQELVAIIELEDDDSIFNKTLDSHGQILQCSDTVSCVLEWSEDGKLFAVTSPRRILHVFLSQLPMLASVSFSGAVARLTSLLEITIETLFPEIPARGFEEPKLLTVKSEPSFLEMGPNHLAVGSENRVMFFDVFGANDFNLIDEREYHGVIDRIKLNIEYAATKLADGRILLHWIDDKGFPARVQQIAAAASLDPYSQVDQGKSTSLADKLMPYATRQQRTFVGNDSDNGRLGDFEITEKYLIYATLSGKLVHFFLDEWTVINEYKHTNGIKSIFSNCDGTLVVIIDSQGSAFILNPLSNTLTEFPSVPPKACKVFWGIQEQENPLLVILDDEKLTVYRFFSSCIPNTAQTKENDCMQLRIFSSGTLADRSSFTSNSINAEPQQQNLLQLTHSTGIDRRIPWSIFSTTTYGECRLIGATRLPQNHLILGLHRGRICFLSSTGRLVHAPLSTHTFHSYTRRQILDPKTDFKLSEPGEISTVKSGDSRPICQYEKTSKDLSKLSESKLVSLFDQAMLGGDFEDALLLADYLHNRTRWYQLGVACVQNLNFDCAIQVFRRLDHCGLVLAVERMASIEEKPLLYGYVSMFLGDFSRAQDFFLASSRPVAALEMRRDLLHWDSALQLARSLSPDQIPFISREYAFELECVGDYVNALMYFEKALDKSTTNNSTPDGSTKRDDTLEALFQDEYPSSELLGCGDVNAKLWRQHEDICNAGVARNTIRLGDYKRGVAMTLKHPSRSLKKECALILEQSRQWPEAAALYEAAGQIDTAITVYLKCKNYDKAGLLLRQTEASTKVYLEYAKARETEGSFKEAVIAYESAKDWNSVVRLLLEKLNNPTDAARIVNESKSTEGAKMVAQYFTKIGDFASAIQFLVLSKCHGAAYDLAQKHRKMEIYANFIGNDAAPSEYKSIAVYFECEKNWLMAGKFFLFAKQYAKAVRHLLRVPYSDTSAALDLAIEAVGDAKDEKLTHMLIIYLMGETDGLPKDPRHLFRLYMALHQYREAARTAVIIAREEQMAGNYRNAHDLLFAMVQELRQRKIKVASEMLDNLAILHSYTLAKLHIKAGNHVFAARLLIRVAQNISKFPTHIVPILTSTVIECQRTGLKTASCTYASILLRPENRDKIDSKYRRKFEGLVRRPEKQTEEEIEILSRLSPCPFCAADLGDYELNCGSCRNNLPYCALTGKHVVKFDVTLCPNCDFPITYSEIMTFLENNPDVKCPMCFADLTRESIRRLTDAATALQMWNAGEADTPKGRSIDPTTGTEHS